MTQIAFLQRPVRTDTDSMAPLSGPPNMNAAGAAPPAAEITSTSEPKPKPAATEFGHSPDRVRILVVDDEPLMGSAIARVLAEHEVIALTSARAAMLRVIAGERFDVILCDVMMPDFSGIDLYDGIAREAPQFVDRLVFVTGGAYTPDAIAFLERITNLRLEKPIMPSALHDAVRSILRSTQTPPPKGTAAPSHRGRGVEE
jgi:DNA-binding NtrC family response regulator